MQEQILDQNEVDALLQGLSDGQIESEKGPEAAPEGVVPYDFTSQEKTVRGRMPALEMVNEKFCNKVRTPLQSIIRSSVDIEAQGIDSVKYEEFVRNLTLPSSINIFTMPPFRGHGILVMDPSLAYLIIDNYFGGSGRFYTRIEGRDFTTVEQSVIKKVVDVILKTLSEAWKSICSVEFAFEKSEMNPHFVNVIEAVEVMMVSAFHMEIESSNNTDKNLFYFCMPYLSVESIKERLYGRGGQSSIGADEGWIARLRDHIDHVPLHVESEVGGTKIKLSELLKLKTGDVILLDKKIYEPFDFKVEGDAKFRGRPGVSCSNYALEIQSVIEKGG
ncbi:MAG: flagellar motor switch protein FliM [Thermodesulfobacteriota bacterium]